ncbi:MAG TPA: LuxR C-terminal-related transcriptional regulator, partial [Acidimicrobiales bacterium]
GGLLVLEDLHWADPETVAVVEHLSDNLERAPVLCVATVRSDEESEARRLVRRVAARRTSPVLALERLNDAQVAAMVHCCTGGAASDAVDRVVSLADGVPLLVEETLVSPGLPASLAEGVNARLGELAEADREVLLSAAAFGRHFDWRLLGDATGLPRSAVVEALDRGVAAQLLAVEGDGFRFRHALTAEAVFGSVIPPRREAVAAAALAALDRAHAELPDDLRETAARLAERAGRHERAGHLHLALGEQALDRSALRTAVVALERAASLLEPGEARDRAAERLVDALALAGRVDAALEAGEGVVTRLPPTRAAAVHLRLAGAAVTAARWALAREHLTAAAGLVEAARSPELEAELAIREAELAIGTNDTARSEQRARHALQLARDGGLADAECAALQLLGRCARRSSLKEAESWFRRALATAEAHGLSLWRLRALHEIGTIALLDQSAVGALVEAQHLAESLGAMATAAVLDIEIAAGYAGLHDLEGQQRHGREAVRRGGELGMEVVVAYGWQHVAMAAAVAGDPERAALARSRARAAAPGNRDIEGLLLTGQVIVALLAEDRDRARAAAARATEAMRGSETAPPAHARAAWPLLLALDGSPDTAAAIDELERAGVGVNRGGRGWLTLTRAVLAGRTDVGRAAELAARGDAELVPMPMWRHMGRRLAAEAAAADGWAVPDKWLAEAETWFRANGRAAVAAACRTLRRGTPSPVPAAWARRGITRRESDVLTLVIEGCSNREIAERLYLSVRTVEKHVEALLRKTGTSTRTQLARVAATT